MEQWMLDGRQLLFERWQKQGGVVGPKTAPEQVRNVDEKVLQYVLEVFKRNRHHACVSSFLLHKSLCRCVASSSSSPAATEENNSQPQQLEFKFASGQFSPGIDRSGFFGLVQKEPIMDSSLTSTSPQLKPHARVLIDYCWIYQNRIYDFTSDFTFIAGAGVVPQALEEGVLYCLRSKPQEVEFLYEASSSSEIVTKEETHDDESSEAKLVEGSTLLDDMDEFLCDSEFAFRDEGTKLPASDLGVGFDEETKKVIIIKASDQPMVIPSDATVGLFLKVKKFCNAVSAPKHIELAEKLKQKGNEVLSASNNSTTENESAKEEEPRPVAARRWYERAMMELSPEALRIGKNDTMNNSQFSTMKEIQDKIQSVLASLAHNISFCYSEQAANNAANQNEKRELLKKSVRFASEAMKASENKHTKSIFRRASANALLGNYEEADEDLKLMMSVSSSAANDQSVIALRQSIREQVKKSNDELKNALAKEFS